MKWILKKLEGEIDNSTVIAGDFNNPLLIIESITRYKINKEVEDLNNIINQLALADMYRTLHPMTAEYKFFSGAHGTISRTGHILGHKTSLNIFRKI